MFDGGQSTSAAAGRCRKSGEEWMLEDLLKLGHRKEQAACGSQLLLSLGTAELSRRDRPGKPMDFGSRVTV
jgi:hypothetical protein